MKSISDINKENSHKNEFTSKAVTTSFAKQKVSLNNSPLLFPNGLENVFAGLYFIFLPYLTGIVFLFIFISKGSIDIFQSLNTESSFFFSWCIGYECLAGIVLLWILKSAVFFSLEKKNANKEFVRPSI
jgi:hypothetical protein